MLHGGAATEGENDETDFKSRTVESERPEAGSADGGNSQEDRGRRSGDPTGLRGNREDPAGPGAAKSDAFEPLIRARYLSRSRSGVFDGRWLRSSRSWRARSSFSGSTGAWLR